MAGAPRWQPAHLRLHSVPKPRSRDLRASREGPRDQLAALSGCSTVSRVMNDVVDLGAALTIADAARATGTDRQSIRRRLQAGEFPNAFKDAQGFWRIYETDLHPAGAGAPDGD